MNNLLELSEVTKSYDAGLPPAVDRVSFSCLEGQILAVIGSSGSGKTTLLRIIAGLEMPDLGRVTLKGETMNSQNECVPPESRDCSLVFQDYALFPNMTVQQNVAYGKASKNNSELIDRLFDLTKIGDLKNRYPHQISGGEQQRVALVRALATQPSLLLLDEPLSHLDPELRNNVRCELLNIFRVTNTTALFVSHDTEDALTMADQVVVMHEAEIVQIGTPVELFEKPRHTFVGHFIGSPGMNILPCSIENGQINFGGKILPNKKNTKKNIFQTTQVGIRPEFINFSKDGIEVKIKRVSDTGRHKVVDAECSSGKIKILANSSTQIPSDNAYVTFDQKYTYAYGDNWIIE